MRVLVTGASGFLGSHIVDQCLQQGDSVRVLVRKESNLSYLNTLKEVEKVWGDLSDSDSLQKALQSTDVVIHSAARVVDFGSREQFYRTNVYGTQSLIQAAKKRGVGRLILISSPSALMTMTDQIDVNESCPYPKKFVNLYSETKAAAEQLVLQANSPNLMTCALRPRAIWGPRDRSGFLPRILAKMADGKFPDISGGKKVYASLCYCENAAAASLLAAKSDQVGGKAYFITDRERVDVWKFVSDLASFFNLPPLTKKVHPQIARGIATAIDTLWKLPFLANQFSPPISRYSVGLLTLSSTYDWSAAARDFKYDPVVDQETGLARFKNWLDGHGGVKSLVH